MKNKALMILIMSVDTKSRPAWPTNPSVVANESSGLALECAEDSPFRFDPTTDWVSPAASSVPSRVHNA